MAIESLLLPDIGVDVIEQFLMEFDRIHRRAGSLRRIRGIPARSVTYRRRGELARFAVVAPR